MTDVILKEPLTTEEIATSKRCLEELDPENTGIVTSENAKRFVLTSGLSPDVLDLLWSLIDRQNRGFLTSMEFAALLRSIGNLEEAPFSPITTKLFEKPSANGFVQQKGPEKASILEEVAPNLPLLSSNDLSKFSQLFDRTTGNSKEFQGPQAKNIFLKSKLSNETLASIWFLCDRNQSGSLEKEEFIMAMHLIDLCLRKNELMTPVPKRLSKALWDSIDLNTLSRRNTLYARAVSSSPNPTPSRSLSASNTKSTTNSEGMKSDVAPPPTSSHSNGKSTELLDSKQQVTESLQSKPIFSPFDGESNDWRISMGRKQEFIKIFRILDKRNKGFLESTVLVPFFLKSKLDKNTLANIWELSSLRKQNSMNETEFSVAMFLIEKTKANVPLPKSLPDDIFRSLNDSKETALKNTNEMTRIEGQQVSSREIKDDGDRNIAEKLSHVELKEEPGVPEIDKLTLKKLDNLHKSLFQSRKLTEVVSSKITESIKRSTLLQRQLEDIEMKLNPLDSRLVFLKDEINKGGKNSTLEKEIDESTSLVDSLHRKLIIKEKELESDEQLKKETVEGLGNDIKNVDEKLQEYISKKRQLETYDKSINEKKIILERKFRELEEQKIELERLETEFNEKSDRLKLKNESLLRVEDTIREKEYLYAHRLTELESKLNKETSNDLMSPSSNTAYTP
ncbi:hypothetical protein KAFR_0G00820 [Kazachstania africana CBS 2517]|uniref:Uncharacterized protein n=1 Tax=Kazachstania africana (strain ATCC 22294 / BCRC 22015 / CBS 2517 / CECT 1963 / NBRC 1671 / NRRL Y-8276) TaxID=1071382 RepID=H2AXL5_KAZAF|nr:hypothetical protein KAFR_0G00820 [Kazachstania africana CBS 2517]CCF59115.1 hypothetical protein KAFR_0G00820 [Kazachstania africana CBS 2517]